MRNSVVSACLLLLATTCVTAPAAILPPPDGAPKMAPIAVRSYVLMDYRTGRVLAAKHPHEALAPASTTKLMTAFIVFEEMKSGHISADTQFHISNKARQQGGSRMFVEAGSDVSVANLLKGILVPSGNDAAMALAEGISGSEQAFVQRMNRQAKRLGLNDTHYTNPNGLPAPGLHSSAFDLARLSRAIITRFPEDYARFFAVKSFTWNKITQANYNKLLWRDPSVDGLKPGYVSAVGYNLAASAKRGNMRLIGVVMGANKPDASSAANYINLADVTESLLDYGFKNFVTRRLYDAGQPVLQAPIAHGEQGKIGLGLAAPLDVTIARGQYPNLKAKADLPKKITAPIKKGQRIGRLVVRRGKTVIASAPLVALSADARYHFW